MLWCMPLRGPSTGGELHFLEAATGTFAPSAVTHTGIDRVCANTAGSARELCLAVKSDFIVYTWSSATRSFQFAKVGARAPLPLIPAVSGSYVAALCTSAVTQAALTQLSLLNCRWWHRPRERRGVWLSMIGSSCRGARSRTQLLWQVCCPMAHLTCALPVCPHDHTRARRTGHRLNL